jgi:hypothetical protein
VQLSKFTIMSGPAKTALSALKTYVMGSKSRMKKLVTDTSAAQGTRAQPAKTGKNDAAVGSRLDFGPTTTKNKDTVRKFNFQLNKDASNSSVKKLAAKDSHKVWSTAEITTKANPTDAEVSTVVKALFSDLEKNIKDK